MVENLEVECKDCYATFKLQHNLNITRYEIGFCPFCGSEDIEMEEDYEDEENEEDYY